MKNENRRSSRTTSRDMQTAPFQPSHQQKMHQTRVLPGRGVASYPLQHSPPNFQHLPHTQPGPPQTNQTNQLPLRHRRALQLKKLQRKHLHRLLLHFHRVLHARETTAASLPTTTLTLSTAPNLIAVGAMRRTLTATLVAVPLDVTYFATLMACQPLGRLLFFVARP